MLQRAYFRFTASSVLLCCLPGFAQSSQFKPMDALPEAPGMGVLTLQEQSGQNQNQSVGTISGTVVDPNGNVLLSAQVRLTREGPTEERQVASDGEGHFV